MRKRQWKKILSVVLALAMVFSMNVSAFADEVTDPVAVEEPAAEEPVAEAPVESNEETPKEETKEEEPAAPAEEPAAEESAPAEEAAPVESEEAAGDLSGLDTAGFSISPVEGVTFDANVLTLPEGEFTLTVIENAPASAITVKNAAGETASFTVVAKEGQTAAATVNVQKADTGSLSGTVGTSTVVVGAEGALYKSSLAAATTTSAEYKVYPDKKDTPDGTFGSANINPAGGKFADGVVVYKADGTEVTFEAVEKAAETTDAVPYYAVTTSTKALEVVAVPKKAAGAESFTGTLESNGTSIDVSEAVDGKEYGAFAGDTLVDTNVATSSTATLTGLELGTKYTVKLRTVSAATAFASMWSPGKDITTPVLPVVTTGEITEDCEINSTGEVTVSGLKITGPFKGTAVRKDKDIFEVTVSDGKVTVEKDATAPQKAVSFNIIKNGGAIFSVGTSGKYAGGMITLKGTNTVSLDCVDGEYKIFTDDTINVEGDVTLSANDSGEALVISENSAFKVVRAEKDAPVKPSGKIKVYLAREDTTGFAAAAGIKLDKNTIDSTAGDKFVISNNKVFKLGANAKFNVEECGANDAVGYGKTVVWSNHGDFGAASAIKYQTLPEQLTNTLLSDYTVVIPDGAITDGALDLDLLIIKKNGVSLKDPDRASALAAYEFALSTNSSMKARDLYAAYYDGNSGDIDEDTNQDGIVAKKTYTLYVRKADDGYKFASPAVAVPGSVTLKETGKLVINGGNKDVTAKIYYGGQAWDKKADRAIDAVKNGDISFALEGYTWNKDDLTFEDSMGDVVGSVKYFVFKRSVAEATGNLAKIMKAEAHDDADLTALTAVTTENTGLANDAVVSENGYYMKAFLVPSASTGSGSKKVFSGDISSNVISFNVAAAPVTIKTNDAEVPVGEKLDDGDAAGWKAVNDITGQVVENDNFNVGSAPVYKFGAASYNAATVTTYTVSEGKVVPALTAPGAAKYVISKIDPGKLSVFGEVAKSSVTVTPGKVYYGENKTSIVGNMKVTYNNGADTKEADYSKGDYSIEFYKPETLSAGAVSGGSVVVTPQDIDAETEIAAIVELDKSKIVGTNSQNIVMPAVTFTVQKRPIIIEFDDCTDATGTGLHSKRNIALKTPVSANAKKLHTVEDEVAVIRDEEGNVVETHTNSGALKPASDLANVLSENAVLDHEFIDIAVAKTYTVPLIGSSIILNNNYAKNFVVKEGYANYKIDPVYYAYYILEYGGHKVKVGKKTIYKETQEPDELGKVVWKLPKELQGVSFNTFGGAITDEKDKVVGFDAQEYDGTHLNYYGKDDFAAGVNLNEDVYFYAIVRAYATNNVTIDSLSPVTYDGRKHTLGNYDYKKEAWPKSTKTVIPDVGGLNVVDRSNDHAKTLMYGVDYKVTVKNNTNASVKYDRSTAVSDNLTDRGAVTQLFSEKKRPQVVITGIGDYKGLKATVYFDIKPRDITTVDEVDPDAGKLQTNPAGYDANVLKLGKKKGVKYSYKVKDNIVNNVDGKGEIITKKATLKKNKDYTESFVKYVGTAFNPYAGATKVVDPKTLTTAGIGYGVVLNGTGNYFGTVEYPVDVVANNAKLFSELGWSAKNVNYKATGVSTDSAKGNFNVKASKKYNKKKLVYNTDYTATINGAYVKDGLAYDADTYDVVVKPTAAFLTANAADIAAGKLVPDSKILYPKVKAKKLNKKMFTITPSAKGVAFTGENFEVAVTSSKLSDKTDYIPLPGTVKSKEETWNNALINDSDRVREQLGESAIYVSVWDVAHGGFGFMPEDCGTEGSMAVNADGDQKDVNIYEYTFTAANANKRLGEVGGNYRPGTYNVTIFGRGAYRGEKVVLSYKVNGAKLTNKTVNTVLSADKVEANINGTTTTLNLKLPYKVKAYYREEGTWKNRVTDVVTQSDYATANYSNPFFTVGAKDWKNNTKATTKAKVTIHPTEFSGYAVTKKGVTGTFKIDVNTISKNQVVSYNEFERMLRAGEDTYDVFYVSIDDKAEKAKNPKVVMYQARQDGGYGKAIKQKTDYTFKANTVSTNGNTVSINAGTGKKSSYKVTETATVKQYDVFAKNGKKWELVLSGNATTLSANGKYIDVPMTLNKAGNSGTVEYNGYWIGPVIQDLTVDGVQIVSGGKLVDGKKIGISVETITDGESVGTQKFKITIKNGTENKGAYEVGGSKVFTYKIVPQKSSGLILSK